MATEAAWLNRGGLAKRDGDGKIMERAKTLTGKNKTNS
jgi:hypothetical protein